VCTHPNERTNSPFFSLFRDPGFFFPPLPHSRVKVRPGIPFIHGRPSSGCLDDLGSGLPLCGARPHPLCLAAPCLNRPFPLQSGFFPAHSRGFLTLRVFFFPPRHRYMTLAPFMECFPFFDDFRSFFFVRSLPLDLFCTLAGLVSGKTPVRLFFFPPSPQVSKRRIASLHQRSFWIFSLDVLRFSQGSLFGGLWFFQPLFPELCEKFPSF